MGIPAFYRWLTDRFPLAASDVVEESPVFVNGVQVPMDTSKPNPNGLEFDNLYLDMNGIIHPCFHPEGLPAPKTYEEVFRAVFNFIDRLFSIVRPRKLLYMAIDGVAPRAKMNQQRARRFRTAKEAEDAASGEERLRSALLSEEEKLVALEQTKALDSNVITPGTEFMASLSSALWYYTHLRMNTDPGWRGLKVILSDANVPGEGEHKIMSYIRLQRNMPGFDPNTRHCLYGLDADLIMLALATHEIHFSILREDVRKSQQNDRAPKSGNYFTRLSSKNKEMKAGETGSEYLSYYISKQNFQFLNIWVLRDYLMHDMRVPDSAVKTDLERLIDDFVFMCIFVGNDFLPHVPSLNIHEGAIDLLMDVYKKEFARMGGYLTHSFEVNLERVQHFVQVVGANENAIFRKRSQVQKEREKQFQASSHIKHGRSEPCSSLPHAKKKNKSNRLSFWPFVDKSGSKCADLKNPATKDSSGFANKAMTNGENVTVDNIKLGEEGWKERFYSVNFGANTGAEREKIRSHAVLKYIEGICWVMHYYYQGVCSWQWFYPYHYAPFASDFYGLDLLEIHFILGEPFKPFDQLMGVLPAASAHALPLFYRKLMTDASSPISDFYPTDFELDMNGKKFTWQAICKLPFIKESHLLAEIAKVEHTLTDEEMRRNALGLDVLFVHITHPLATKIFSFCKRNKDHPKLTRAKIKRKIDPEVSGGMNGYIYISDKPVWPLEVSSPIEDMEIITMNKAISVFYRYPPSHPHIPRPPEGVVMPQMSVSKNDVTPAPVLWHEKSTVIGRLFSKRLPARAISGSRLAKSAHRLVLKHYLENKQKDVGPAELDGHVTVGASSRSNSKVMLPEGKIDNGKRNCTTDSELEKSKQHKRQKVETNLSESPKVEIDNGHNIADIRNQSNSKEMVLESEMEDGERKMNGRVPEENKNRKMQASLSETPPAEFDSHDTVEVPCQSNSKDTALESKVEDGERSCMIDSKAGQNMEPIGQNNLVEELAA